MLSAQRSDGGGDRDIHGVGVDAGGQQPLALLATHQHLLREVVDLNLVVLGSVGGHGRKG